VPPVKLNIEEVAKFIPNTFYPFNTKIAVSHASYAVVKGAEIVAVLLWQGSLPSSFL
jgi:hypothetical protein